MYSALKAVMMFIITCALVHILLNSFNVYPNYRFLRPIIISNPTDVVYVVNKSKMHGQSIGWYSGPLNDTRSLMSTFQVNNESVQLVPQNSSLEECDPFTNDLSGPIKLWMDGPDFEQLQQIYPYLEPGGHGKPKDCRALHRVAIIVPYRDREEHLRIFLHNLHSLMIKQRIDYAIFIVEQIQNETFNRAKLMNVGFAEANKLYDWQCYIFHDVDLLPEDDRNIYSCPIQPRHMSASVDKFKYKLPYGSIFGGVVALTKQQFIKVNGFSNDYWGWGGEDDDLSARVTLSNYKIMRYPANIARYKMIKHSQEKSNPLNPCRYDLLAETSSRKNKDGISSLQYVRHGLELLPLYTLIKAELLQNESVENLRAEGFINC